jgi:recombination protein U
MKYPKGVKPNHKQPVVSSAKRTNEVKYGQRGMTLEKDLDKTNDFYLHEGLAVIHKKPTPVQIVNVDYPSRNKAKISEAYFKVPSTSDYNGIYKSRYIDFEAKETKNKSRFPFINIHDHQVLHMRQCMLQGGIVFLIIRFSVMGETYMMPFESFDHYWQAYLNGGRKSIKYDDIKNSSILLKEGINPRVDYISAVDEFYFKNGAF